ncbi:hypothetical protein MIND_00682900 [Mycena indigotica]|uniref:Uncharacterized protein n=1 Tax=Mycena indigotica TaxID=2126181 RepID=A0A8H6W0N9_9AGAR|nr:uncharacterized protein MIND_00682900 [Mycena indigotica]KAF7301184.1 hypothetical protein MIND_00682900 [Mycena indigotica]
MPNPKGVNGSSVKVYPPDDQLRETLLKYVKRGHTQQQKLERLIEDHQLKISIAVLNKLERRLGIPSVKGSRRVAAEVAAQAVIDELEKDLAQNNGPNYVKMQLQNKLILVPRAILAAKKTQIHRTPLSALGPFHEICSDGHEKLGAQALQMGGIGLPIYAFKDKWTAKLLKINVVPNDRTNAAIGHLYLDFVAETSGTGLQMTVDKGSEIGWMLAMQDCLREIFAPNIDPDVYPAHICVKSVHNTVIEAFWRWLKVEHIFSEITVYHRHLFNWIFPSLVQAELDDFRSYWNSHKIRYQADKIMPSGHVPSDAAEHPQLFGGINCFIKVPVATVEDLRAALSDEVGPREQHLRWVSPEFEQFAQTVYESLGRPDLTLASSWDVFSQMSLEIERLGPDMWPEME